MVVGGTDEVEAELEFVIIVALLVIIVALVFVIILSLVFIIELAEVDEGAEDEEELLAEV